MEPSIDIYRIASLASDQWPAPLKNAPEGLSTAEAQRRWQTSGGNILPEYTPDSIWEILIRQFMNGLVLLLLIASFVSVSIGHEKDAYFILFVLVINALVGFQHEYQASKIVASLHTLTPRYTRVKRSGKISRLNTDLLVPGDMIVLTAGDQVPADACLVSAVNLATDESSLTGESINVEKRVGVVSDPRRLSDLNNSIFMGTHIVSGHCQAVVAGTGSSTELGKISNVIKESKTPLSPLQRQINSFTKQVSLAIVLVTIALYVIGLFAGIPSRDILLSAITLAVAAIPEGLPILITVVMAVGIKKMAAEKALVKKITAVETLGQIHTLITDKTGTVTENSMAVTSITTRVKNRWVVQSADSITKSSISKELAGVIQTSLLNGETNTNLDQLTDPIERAIDTFSRELALSFDPLDKDKILLELPFDSTHKFAAIAIKVGSRTKIMIKGAPQILQQTAFKRSLRWWQVVEEIGSRGEKLIATGECYLPPGSVNDSLGHQQLAKLIKGKLIITGLIALADPILPDSAAIIAQAQQAGIRVVMATGDLKSIAYSVAGKLQIPKKDVFAEITPVDKLRLVKELQRSDGVVAMTGDGVNDAPALKQADAGLAMGQRGTDVAKAAADIVILDDSLKTIITAIRSGRTIFRNIQRVVSYYLATNIAEVSIVAISIISAGLIPLPLLPVQILWINLVTDGFTVLPLALEPDHDDVMRQRPRSRRAPLLDNRFWHYIAVTNVILIALTLGAFLVSLTKGHSLQYAQTIAFGVLSFAQIFNFLNARSIKRSFFTLGFNSNPATLISFFGSLLVQLSIFLIPVTRSYLGLAPIGIPTLLILIGYCSLAFWLVELYKRRSITS